MINFRDRKEEMIDVLDIIVSSSYCGYSFKFEIELLKYFLGYCDLNLTILPNVSRKCFSSSELLSIQDFVFENKRTKVGMFCLFQAGASPEFIRYFSKNCSRGALTDLDHCNTDLCRALVLELNIHFKNLTLTAPQRTQRNIYLVIASPLVILTAGHFRNICATVGLVQVTSHVWSTTFLSGIVKSKVRHSVFNISLESW